MPAIAARNGQRVSAKKVFDRGRYLRHTVFFAGLEPVVHHSLEMATMPRKAKDITDAELAVLEQLWEHSLATVRELAERLYGSSDSSDLATVQKLLGRLETKACVSRNRKVWPHQFQATIRREDLIQRRLQSTADQLCGGSLAPLLTHLVSNEKLDRQERQHLRKLLDELAGPSDKRPGPSKDRS